jgi:hypothetical protein
MFSFFNPPFLVVTGYSWTGSLMYLRSVSLIDRHAECTDLDMDWPGSFEMCLSCRTPSFCDVWPRCRRVWIACRWLNLLCINHSGIRRDCAVSFVRRRWLLVVLIEGSYLCPWDRESMPETCETGGTRRLLRLIGVDCQYLRGGRTTGCVEVWKHICDEHQPRKGC